MFLKNLNVLDIKNPDLARRLREIPLEAAQKEVSVLEAKSGDLVIAYNNRPLDDIINPIENSKNIWNKLVKNELTKNDITLVFGLGLGYLFKRAYVSSNSRIIVYEPRIEIIRFVLEYVDFSEQFKEQRIYMTDNEEECLRYLSEKYISKDKIEIVYSDIYLNLFSDDLLNLSQKILRLCESKKADILTISKLSKEWIKNNINNFKRMKNSRPLSLLKNIFAGKTALILAAGPSLKDNLDLIKQNRSKFVVFAVNKVLDYLIENEIEPNFLIAADAKWLKHTMKVDPEIFEKINLIPTTKADNFIYAQNFHSIFNYYLNNDSFYEELNKKFPEEIKLNETEGTAVSQCYYSALEMGFSKVVFCGLDLAIKQDNAYAPNLNVTYNNDGSAVFTKQVKNIVEIKSVSGEMVKTRDDYAVFAIQLESAFLKNTSAKLYNTSDFGAYLEGMIYESMSSIVRNIEPVGIDVNSKIKELYILSEQRWKEIYKAQQDILQKQRESLVRLKPRVLAWIEKNKPIIESVDRENITKDFICKLEKVKSEEFSLIKDILHSTILGEYYQAEFLEYSNINQENSDFMAARLYSLNLLEKMPKFIDYFLSCLDLINA